MEGRDRENPLKLKGQMACLMQRKKNTEPDSNKVEGKNLQKLSSELHGCALAHTYPHSLHIVHARVYVDFFYMLIFIN